MNVFGDRRLFVFRRRVIGISSAFLAVCMVGAAGAPARAGELDYLKSQAEDLSSGSSMRLNIDACSAAIVYGHADTGVTTFATEQSAGPTTVIPIEIRPVDETVHDFFTAADRQLRAAALPSTLKNSPVPSSELLAPSGAGKNLFALSEVSGHRNRDGAPVVLNDASLTNQYEIGVPEPAAVSMIAVSLIGFIALRRRSR